MFGKNTLATFVDNILIKYIIKNRVENTVED